MAGTVGAVAASFWLPRDPETVRVAIPGPTVTVTTSPALDEFPRDGEVYYFVVGRPCPYDRPGFYRATPVAASNKGVLLAALRALFSHWDGPRLVQSVSIERGIATVDFASLIATQQGWASTSCGSVNFVDSLNRTVFQFETVRGVIYQIEGSCEAFHGFLQGSCDDGRRLLTRAEWESFPSSTWQVRYARRT